MKKNNERNNTPWAIEKENDFKVVIFSINNICNTTRIIYFEENYEKS